ncbi:MAG: 2-C-methyl-D-erythritol 4-phosphate cytidylyltransferase [Nitrospirota bacterium]
MIVAVVPAAGIGKRFGSGANKPFLHLCGKPLIIWSLETLHSVNAVREIIPVLKEEDMEQGRKIFESYGFSKIKRISPGGKERQDSVYNGLKLVEDKDCMVIIHDGVRPLIGKDLVEKLIDELKDFDGAVLSVPVKDTIKEAEDEIVKKTLKRDSLWAIQTPQIFSFRTISGAYEKAIEEGFYATDDAALVEKYGGNIKIVMGSYRNIKITTPEDMAIAEFLLTKK